MVSGIRTAILDLVIQHFCHQDVLTCTYMYLHIFVAYCRKDINFDGAREPMYCKTKNNCEGSLRYQTYEVMLYGILFAYAVWFPGGSVNTLVIRDLLPRLIDSKYIQGLKVD